MVLPLRTKIHQDFKLSLIAHPTSTISVVMFVIGKPQDLDQSSSFCGYSWLEFYNLPGAG